MMRNAAHELLWNEHGQYITTHGLLIGEIQRIGGSFAAIVSGLGIVAVRPDEQTAKRAVEAVGARQFIEPAQEDNSVL